MSWLALVICSLATAADPAPFAGIERLDGKGEVRVGASEVAEYAVDTAARSTQVFLLPDGPRTVRALVVVAQPATRDAWRAARLRLVWDDDNPEPTHAAVDLSIGGMFDASHGEGVVGVEGDAWVFRLPMPYRSRAIVRIDADAPIAGLIRVRTTRENEPNAGYLHAREWNGGDRFTWDGRGHCVGVRVVGDESAKVSKRVTMTLDDAPARPLADLLTVKNEPRMWFLARTVALRPRVIDRRNSALPEKSAVLFYWYADRPASKRSGGP